MNAWLEKIQNLPRDPSLWPLLPRLAMFGALFFLILLGGYLGDVQDQLDTLDSGVIEEAKLKEQYLQKKQQAVNLQPHRQQLEDIDRSFGALLKQLPDRAQMDALLVDINRAGLGRGFLDDLDVGDVPHHLDHLEHLLHKKREDYRNVLIVVEGVYSMDGDTADLPRLLDIRDRYGVWLLVDEAHSLGVLGKTGRGLAEHQGVDAGRIDLVVGTLSKSLATCGGYVCAKKSIIDYFRFTLPGFVYSVGLSPVILTAARTALRLMQEETWRLPGFFAPGKVKRGSTYGNMVQI